MSKFSRRTKKSIDKMSRELLKKMTKPDQECDKCEKPYSEECYLTCPDLFERNKIRYSSLYRRAEALVNAKNNNIPKVE